MDRRPGLAGMLRCDSQKTLRLRRAEHVGRLRPADDRVIRRKPIVGGVAKAPTDGAGLGGHAGGRFLRTHGLTSIYLIRYIFTMESTFGIIAEPNRRAILSLLASSERSVNEIERQLRMPQPSVSKHLRVLREAGFVESRVDAQRRVYSLRAEPLIEVDAWLEPFRRFWSAHVDALEHHLDRTKRVRRKSKKEKKR